MFAIGNIAPDLGIPDEAWENFTPAVEVTHFKAENGSGYEFEDLRFIKVIWQEKAPKMMPKDILSCWAIFSIW